MKRNWIYPYRGLRYMNVNYCYFYVFFIDLNHARGSQWGCSKHGTRLIFWMFHATRLTPLRPSTNNTVIWTKIIHDTRLIFSLFHDTRLIFWMFHATRLTPLRPSHAREKNYLPTHETDTGTKMAVSFANIFTAKFETVNKCFAKG